MTLRPGLDLHGGGGDIRGGGNDCSGGGGHTPDVCSCGEAVGNALF